VKVIRLTATLASVVAMHAIVASAGAHTLKAERAASANKTFSRGFCNSIVDDPDLGTCTAWTSGPCSRVSAHRVRCAFTSKLEKEDGSRILCRQVLEWSVPGNSGALRLRSLDGLSECRLLRPPDPVVPEG
jgi:hypothetical protein